MQLVLGQLYMSWDTHLTWLIPQLASCHVDLMTSIDSSPSFHPWRHFKVWLRRHVELIAATVPLHAVHHKALFGSLPPPYVIPLLCPLYSINLCFGVSLGVCVCVCVYVKLDKKPLTLGICSWLQGQNFCWNLTWVTLQQSYDTLIYDVEFCCNIHWSNICVKWGQCCQWDTGWAVAATDRYASDELLLLLLLNKRMIIITWDSYSRCEGTVQN